MSGDGLLSNIYIELKDKVSLITGVSSGIGRITALLFGENDAKLVLTDINEEEGNRLSAEILSKGEEAIFVKTDISNLLGLFQRVSLAYIASYLDHTPESLVGLENKNSLKNNYLFS